MNTVNETPPQVVALKRAVHDLTADLQEVDALLGSAMPCLEEVAKRLLFPEAFGLFNQPKALERLRDELEHALACVRQARDTSELSWCDPDDFGPESQATAVEAGS